MEVNSISKRRKSEDKASSDEEMNAVDLNGFDLEDLKDSINDDEISAWRSGQSKNVSPQLVYDMYNMDDNNHSERSLSQMGIDNLESLIHQTNV